MTESELLVLPRPLSMHQQGELNIATSATEDLLNQYGDEEDQLEILLARLMLKPQTLTQWQHALKHLEDDLGVPEAVKVEAWNDETLLSQFSTAQKRLYLVFQQLLQDERKSTKYHQAFYELCQLFPAEESLWHMHFHYVDRWKVGEPAQRQQELKDCLSEHPDWLMVRLLYARQFLKESDADFAKRYATALDHKFLLHEHTQNADEMVAYQFYLDTYMYFALSGQLHRASFAFWQAHQVCSTPDGLYPLALFILSTCENGPEDSRFASWAHFMQQTAALAP